MTRVVPDPTKRLIKLRAMIFANQNNGVRRLDDFRCCEWNTARLSAVCLATVWTSMPVRGSCRSCQFLL